MTYNHPAMQRITLDQIQLAARQHFDGHALHHLRLDEIPRLMADGLCYQLSTWVMTEDLSPKPERLNFFKNQEFTFRLTTEYPATWWQMFKRDHMPEWFKKRWPVRYRTEHHRRKVSSWLRTSGTVSFEVKAAYPKLPEVHPDCGIPKFYQSQPSFSASVILDPAESFELPREVQVRGSVDGQCVVKMDTGEVVEYGRAKKAS